MGGRGDERRGGGGKGGEVFPLERSREEREGEGRGEGRFGDNTNQLIHQSINQSRNQSTRQTVSQTIKKTIKELLELSYRMKLRVWPENKQVELKIVNVDGLYCYRGGGRGSGGRSIFK